MNNKSKYYRLRRLASFQMWTLKLQLTRIKVDNPFDEAFPLRIYADFYFMISTLKEYYNTGKQIEKLLPKSSKVEVALHDLYNCIPELKVYRNVLQHMDEYVIGEGRKQSIDPAQLETSIIEGTKLYWLGNGLNTNNGRVKHYKGKFQFDAEEAFALSNALFKAIVEEASKIN